jgi:dihydrofolate reductase
MEIIVAVAQNDVIGDSHTNQLLWHVPADLSRFYRMTKGQVVIMGRKTFESLPLGKLPHRINVVLTHHIPVLNNFECKEPTSTTTTTPIFFVTFSMLWDVLSQVGEKKIFVIGGSAIYKLLLPFCSVIHYTLVDLQPVGDVLFPMSRDELHHASSRVEYEPDAAGAAATEEESWYTSTESVRYKFITYHLN